MLSQHPTASVSCSSRFGLHARHHTGALRWMVTFSAPALSRMLTVPSYMPSARYRPSLVHDWQMIRLPTLCFTTLFSSGDHSPKSEAVALASCWVTGLYASDWIVSLWWYFRIPSALSVHTMIVLSAPPLANRFPFEAYATQNTASLCPFKLCSRSPSAAS